MMIRKWRDPALRTRGGAAWARGARRVSLTIDARRRLNAPATDDTRRVAEQRLRTTRLRVPVVIASLQKSDDAAH
jgi:hypothetical protein